MFQRWVGSIHNRRFLGAGISDVACRYNGGIEKPFFALTANTRHLDCLLPLDVSFNLLVFLICLVCLICFFQRKLFFFHNLDRDVRYDELLAVDINNVAEFQVGVVCVVVNFYHVIGCLLLCSKDFAIFAIRIIGGIYLRKWIEAGFFLIRIGIYFEVVFPVVLLSQFSIINF